MIKRKIAKLTITLLTLLMMLSNLCIYANNIDLNNAISIKMKLNGLNFFNPLSLTNVGDNVYEVSLYNKIYD